MVHWHDAVPGPKAKQAADCNSDDPETGFVTTSCLKMFDSAVQWAADSEMWVILTSRAAQAAGDGGDGHTVFTNATLATQMVSMWSFLANRYKHVDRFAGFEVMSEPRTPNTGGVVSRFQQRACEAVW
eukprot:SAG31_NODE_8008_length_1542_cov_2.801109_1_plen_128_part_00